MASPSENATKPLDRQDSRKAQNWWWESHVNPRNLKWLSLSLEDLDQKTALMMKLIEDDGDTFARKAEMYYKRRPELIEHVNEFQRMYRTLAERYDQLTSDLVRNLNDITLQAPVTPELESEPSTPRFHSDVKLNRYRSTHRAAGFEVFLGVPVRSPREVSPFSDFEDPDVSSVSSYTRNHSEEALLEKTIQIDSEMYNGKESTGNSSLVELQLKLAGYEVEIGRLKMELENVRSLNSTNLQGELSLSNKANIDEQEVVDEKQILVVQEDTNEIVISDPEKVRGVLEELKLTKGRLHNLELQNERLSTENKLAHENISQLRDQLKEAQKDVAVLRSKLDSEMRRTSKWEEKVARLKNSLKDRDYEIRLLSDTVGDAKLHAEITRLTTEKDRVEVKVRELELQCHTLQTQHTGVEKKLIDEIEQLKNDLNELKLKYDNELKIQVGGLQEEVERQKILVSEAEEEKREAIRQLCVSLEHYRRGYEQLREASSSHKELPASHAS